MTVTTAELRAATDEDLRGWYALGDEAGSRAVLSEAARRDRADALRRAREAERAEWAHAAHAQMLAAEAELRGNLVSRRGVAAGVSDWSLWSGTAARAMAYATEELRLWWQDPRHPRVTVTDYRRQITAGHRLQRGERERDACPAPDDSTDSTTPTETEESETMTMQADTAVTATPEADGRAAREAEIRARVADRAAQLRRQFTASGPGGQVAVRPPAAPVRQRPVVDGAQVLGYAEALIRRYCRMPSQAAADALVLWAAHAHARDAAGVLLWDATPRLMFLSSEPGSGKSRALELTGMLCPETHGLDTEPSQAGLIFTIAKEHATVLLDESDLLFGAGKRHAGIRAVLNSGAYRSGTVLRMRGSKGERANVFGPVALAGLDVMKTATGEALAPLFSRAIVIRMRKSPDPVPRLDREARTVAGMIRTALAAWTASVRDDLASARPEIPGWLMNRSEEIWGPLLAVAEAAGGEWPDRARRACEELALLADSAGEADDDVMSDLAAMVGGWED